jgi:hypothetical protein
MGGVNQVVDVGFFEVRIRLHGIAFDFKISHYLPIYFFLGFQDGIQIRLAMKQCLLAVRDMRDTNAGGNVYGFVTTGKAWRMLKYDPASANMPRTGSDLDSNASISKPSLSSASAWGNLE